jgi:protein-S-isoprenylcysteine O-methyltransferase Ste14
MESAFRVITAIIAASALAVRAFHARRLSRPVDAVRVREPLALALQVLSLVLGSSSLALFILFPSVLGCFSVPLSAWVRGVGAAAGAGSVALLLRSYAALGPGFSPYLQTRKGQRLVTAGPYRFMRHPMYAAYILQTLAWTLLSANAAVALAWAPMVAGLLIRMRIEERMMRQRYGTEYEEYHGRTGGIFPRLPPRPGL